MWIIWKEEFKKIAARKIIWIAVMLLLFFVTFRLFSQIKYYEVIIDGERYYGREAIQKDQELTKKYAGALTEEKLYQIHEKYGFYPYFGEGGDAERNFLNRYITDRFTDSHTMFGYDAAYDGSMDIHFYEGEEWEHNVKPYLGDETRFDYIYGWSDCVESYMLLLIVLDIILIVGLSPVFAEEYMLRTADILRTTKLGKSSGIWMKVSASCVFSILLTVLASLYLLGIYLLVYGTQGLDASSILLNFASFYGYCPESVGGFLIFIVALAVFSDFLLTGITLGYSSACKNSFLALILSVVVFLVPVFWMKVLLPMCQDLLRPAAAKLITHFMISMPVYLPMSTGFSLSGKQIAMHLGIAFVVGGLAMVYGYFRYRNCRD